MIIEREVEVRVGVDDMTGEQELMVKIGDFEVHWHKVFGFSVMYGGWTVHFDENDHREIQVSKNALDIFVHESGRISKGARNEAKLRLWRGR